MSDRRVIRGNTYSGNIPIMANRYESCKRPLPSFSCVYSRGKMSIRRRQLTPGDGGDRMGSRTRRPGARVTQSRAMDPLSLARRASGQEAQGRSRGQGLPPVPGRRHMDNQTDFWLETISDKKEDREFGVQVMPGGNEF